MARPQWRLWHRNGGWSGVMPIEGARWCALGADCGFACGAGMTVGPGQCLLRTTGRHSMCNLYDFPRCGRDSGAIIEVMPAWGLLWAQR